MRAYIHLLLLYILLMVAYQGGGQTLPSGAVLQAVQFSGTDFGAKVNACIAALPSAGGTCDARNFSSPISMTTTIATGSDRKPVTLLLPAGTITLSHGAQFQYFAGSNIIGMGAANNGPVSATTIVDTAPHPVFEYAGTNGLAVGIHISDLKVSDRASGSIAFDFAATARSTITNASATTDIGLKVGGTSTCACYNIFTNLILMTATYGAEFLANANQNQTFGGSYWGSTGIYINGGAMNQFYSPDIENQTTAVNIVSGSNNSFFSPYLEGNRKPILLAPGITGTVIMGASGANGAVIDNSGNTTNYYKLTEAGGGSGSWGMADAVGEILYWGNSIGGDYNDKLALTNSLHNPYLDLLQVGQSISVYGYYGHAPLNIGNLGINSGVSGTGQVQINRIGDPSAPAVIPRGTPGSTRYKYYVICHDKTGGITNVSKAGTTNTGNAQLSSTNYNQIAWAAKDGCWSWDILKGNTNTALATLQRPAITGTTIKFEDKGQPTKPYTPPTRNTTADLAIAGNLTAANIPPRITQTIANGSIALATNSIPSASCQTVMAGSVNSAAAPGVQTTDIIAFTPNRSLKTVKGYSPAATGSLTISAYPTLGYVNFDVCNSTGTPIMPGALTLNWQVTR